MNITRFSIRRPVGIVMIFALACVLGLVSFFRMGVELLPDVDSKFIGVIVTYPGADTESVEMQVTKPVEDTLSSLSHFKKVTSATMSGRAEVFVELDSDADPDMVAVEATKKMSTIRKSLPRDIEEPVVIKRSGDDYPIQQISVSGKGDLPSLYTLAENNFAEKLKQAGGVADIDVSGSGSPEIVADVDPDRLSYYGLSLDDVVNAVKSENVIVTGGSVYSKAKKATSRLPGQYETIEDVKKAQIPASGGRLVTLSDVARVSYRDPPMHAYTTVDGKPAVSMEIYKASGANIVDTADNVRDKMKELSSRYPDYTFTMVYDQSDFIRASLENTFKTLLEGLLTTGLVLFIFLRGWRSSAAVLIAIPVSLVSSLFFMYMAGFTFNMMSLMGMCLCIGILVDDSIVVLENINRFLKKGLPPAEAAERGRMEIGMAAVAMTLCDVVVFLPIAFLRSATGQFFREFGLTIVFATLISLAVSFTLTPMMASRFYAHGYREATGPFWDWLSEKGKRFLDSYERFLRFCLAHPWKLLLPVLLLFAGSMALVPLGLVGSEYMPRTDEGALQINVELPTGFNGDETRKALDVLDTYLLQLPERDHELSRVTTTESNAKISLTLKDRRDRDRSVFEVADGIRQFARENMPGTRVRVTEVQSSATGVSGGRNLVRSPVQVEVHGNDMKQLLSDADKVESVFRKVDGLKDIKNSYVEGDPEIRISVDRDRMHYYGVTMADVDHAFSSALEGRMAGVLPNNPKNQGHDTDIRVRLFRSEGYGPEDMKALPVPSKKGNVTLGDIADIKYGKGSVAIRHSEKERMINVQANLSGRPLSEVIEEIGNRLDGEGLSGRYEFVGQAASMNESFRELVMALAMSLLLIYLLLAVLYESAVTPVIRMLSLPLGLIGAMFCLLVTGNTINLYSLIGILVMDGLVAKNGTLLLDYTLTLIHRGMDPKEAIIKAGKERLRPIFMTAITMVVGMLPSALALSAGSETRSSMAWVIIGGMITSTVFTLLIIPILYLWMKKKWPRRV